MENLRLGLTIHRTERVIQHEDRRVLGQGSRDGGSLLLAAREIDAPFAEHRVDALGQDRERLAQLGGFDHA